MSHKNIIPQDARGMAVRVLLQLDGDMPAQGALDTMLRQCTVDAREASLCTELVYGFLRQELRINYVLDNLLPRRDKLPREMVLVLGTAVYALLFLQRIPHHATVNWAVGYVRHRFGQGLSRVCNGVLRSLQRMGDAPLHAEFYAKSSNPWVQYSMPAWIGELWHKSYGSEHCHELMRRAQVQPWMCVRLNPFHAQYGALRHGFEALAGEWVQVVGSHGWAFAPGHIPTQILGAPLKHWHDEGALSWQSAGSQLAVDFILRNIPQVMHLPMWDACAGQGGKSLALLESGVPLCLSSDLHMGRLRLLLTTSQRLGLVAPLVARMSAQSPALSSWDGNILLDIPCSGLGTLSRRPEIRRRRTMADINALLDTQRAIVAAAWRLLKEGRYLCYMTCTLNPAENEQQVVALQNLCGNVEVVAHWQSPHEHPWLEGMYVVILKKGNTNT